MSALRGLRRAVKNGAPAVWRALRWARRRLQRGDDAAGAVLEALGAGPPLTFVQVGSNDAGYNDPLRVHVRERGWTGVMVEPVPYVFRRLVESWRGYEGRLRFENCAVGAEAGEAEFHYLREAAPGEALPPWYDQVGSFELAHVLKHGSAIPEIEGRLVSAAVPVLTFSQLCERAGLERVDLVHLDTEGHDLAILSSIDLDRHRPAVVIFEHKHLDAAGRAESRRLLTAAGYELWVGRVDTVALHPGRLPAGAPVLRAWSRLGGRRAPAHD